jgi:hypothetical protein
MIAIYVSAADCNMYDCDRCNTRNIAGTFEPENANWRRTSDSGAVCLMTLGIGDACLVRVSCCAEPHPAAI